MSIGTRSCLNPARSTLVVLLMTLALGACTAAGGSTVSPTSLTTDTHSGGSIFSSMSGRTAQAPDQPAASDGSAPASTLGPRIARPLGAEPYDLPIHFGVEYLRYANKEYKTTEPQRPPTRLPSTDGTVTETGYVHGFLKVDGGRTVIFLVADPSVSIDGKTITFAETTDSSPPCM